MSLIRYRTLPMTNLQQQINRMFDQFDSQFFGGSEGLGGGMFAPAVDVKEDAEAYTVHMEVPGVKQDGLSITLQENVLTLRGRKEQQAEHSEGQYRRVERSYGSFARSITLPRSVDANRVSANLEDGVLEVVLPKIEDARPRQISVSTTTTTTASPTQTGNTMTPDAQAQSEESSVPNAHEPTGSPEGMPS